MNQRTENWLGDENWPGTLEEIREFLDTWYFSISEIGHLYVRPQRAQVSWSEFRLFLRRLNLLRSYGFPPLTTLDFFGVRVCPHDMVRVIESVLEFAKSIGANPVVRTRRADGGFLILLAMPVGVETGVLEPAPGARGRKRQATALPRL